MQCLEVLDIFAVHFFVTMFSFYTTIPASKHGWKNFIAAFAVRKLTPKEYYWQRKNTPRRQKSFSRLESDEWIWIEI